MSTLPITSPASKAVESEAGASLLAGGGPWRGIVIKVGLLALLFAGLAIIDRPVYHALFIKDWSTRYAQKDWVIFFRTMGYLPLWIAVALVIEGGQRAMATRGPVLPRLPVHGPSGLAFPRTVLPRHAGLLLLASATLAGLLAEVLQEITRRHRPSITNDGAYVFDWTAGVVAHRGLGLASSHVAVVFGVAFMLWRFSPRMGWPMMVLGVGCGLTRMWAGAHFLSDCVAGVLIAYFTAKALYRKSAR